MTKQQNVITPLAGRDVPWSELDGAILHVINFTPLARVVGDKVQATSKALPYACIKIRHSSTPTHILLPVTHKLDFLNLHKVFESRKIQADEEVNVIWSKRGYRKPFSLFKFGLPRLVIWINHKGAWRLIHGLDSTALEGTAAYKAEAPKEVIKPEVIE